MDNNMFVSTPAPVKVADTAPVKVADTAPVKVADTAPVKVADTAPVKVANITPVKVANITPVKVAKQNQDRYSHYLGYDNSGLAKVSQEYGAELNSVFPEVKEINVKDIMNIKPYDNTEAGQLFESLEEKVSTETKKTLKLGDSNDSYTYTNIGDMMNNSNNDDLRGVLSGYSNSSYMDYNEFMKQ